MMTQTFRRASILGGIILLVIGVACFLQMDWATSFSPWKEGRLTNIFYASILAAIACPVIWISWSGEMGASIGGALDLMLTNLGIAVFLLQNYLSKEDTGYLSRAILFGVFLLISLAIFWWQRNEPIRDSRPMPAPVRLSFAMFAIILLVVGSLLALKQENIFPWVFQHEGTSVLIGWIFLGAAVYFTYGFFRPSWHNAAGQLIGFLAYDLVLIVPFVLHLDDVRDDLMDSLVLYIAVILYSGLLASYYLLVNKSTRLWAVS
jgi:hypothetical protein